MKNKYKAHGKQVLAVQKGQGSISQEVLTETQEQGKRAVTSWGGGGGMSLWLSSTFSEH